MRADRLVAVLLLLQQRQQVTAAQVAQELEISERTARRDLEALGMAGLPVYSVPGRHGGWRLAGGGRTDLSGLSAAEAQALFMVAGPSAGATPELRAALRKLVRALPEPFRDAAERAGASVVIDQRAWGQRVHDQRTPAQLDAVRDAVVHGRQVILAYTSRTGEATSRVVEPLGLAAKAGRWYLVADTEAGMRMFRVDRVVEVQPTGHEVTVPSGFDLSQAWALIADRVEELRQPVVAEALVQETRLALVSFVLGDRLRIGARVADGRVEVEVRGSHARELASELAGFGVWLEVVGPVAVREELARLGLELSELYGS
jgi:predicted DNA-binding transcriptional regulator YafY